MPLILLDDRALLGIHGPDAEHFLQNILTTDLDALAVGETKPGALLSPQGKILFDFLISRHGPEGFRLDCRKEVAGDLLRRLMLYRLRAKVEIAMQDQQLVYASWQNESAASSGDSSASRSDSTVLQDSRFAGSPSVARIYGQLAGASSDRAAWDRLRVDAGVAESGSDYELGDAFPHDALLDQLGGVGFRKGCYVGQEVVSRMQHRGTARRRVLIVTGQAGLPAPGTEIRADGKPIGLLGTVAGSKGLAILRIDKVKAAMNGDHAITAGDAAVTAEIPGWASFTFPEEESKAEEA
jgi:folate-binding protein YgfZ